MTGSQFTRITRTEIRRRLRGVRQNDHRVGLLALVVPAYLLALVVVFGWASSRGQTLTTDTAGGVVSVLDLVAVRTVTVGIVLTGIRVVSSTGRPAAFEGILTGAGHRDVVSAYLVLESALLLALFGPAILVGGLGFALGAGSAVTGLLVVTVGVATVLVTAWSGFAVGLGIRLALARSRFLARYRAVLGVVVALAYVLGLVVGGSSSLFAPTDKLLAATPLSWFSDLALVTAASGADPLRAGAAAVSIGGLLVGLVALNSWLAARLWYATPVEPTTSTNHLSVDRLGALDRQTRHVVQKTWTRAIRSPLRLVYVGYAGLLVAFMLTNAVQHGDWPDWLPIVIGLYGAWATGAGFTLNPVGEEAPILPATLTTPISGRRYVGGLWVASVVPGVPLTFALTVLVAASAGYGLVGLAIVSLLASGLAAFTPGLASGIGTRFPNTEQEDVTRNRQAVVPSGAALLGYSFALIVLVLPFWMATASSAIRDAAAAVGVPRVGVTLLGTGLTLLAVGIAAVASYRAAGDRFDEYVLTRS